MCPGDHLLVSHDASSSLTQYDSDGLESMPSYDAMRRRLFQL
jgi:hypothetical protein